MDERFPFLEDVVRAQLGLPAADPVAIAEITEHTNFSYLFRVSLPGRSLILKLATTRPKGFDVELPRERIFSEARALQWFHRACPPDLHVPELLFVDAEHFAIGMEDVERGRSHLIDVIDARYARLVPLAARFGRALGEVQTRTRGCPQLRPPAEEKLFRPVAFGVLLGPGARVAFPDLWEEIEAQMAERRECLVHGDLWGKNLLVRDAERPAVVDFETAFVGDPAFDLATLLAAFLIPALERRDHLPGYRRFAADLLAAHARACAGAGWARTAAIRAFRFVATFLAARAYGPFAYDVSDAARARMGERARELASRAPRDLDAYLAIAAPVPRPAPEPSGARVHATIDAIGRDAVARLEGSPVDYSFGLLRALERSTWGDLEARYVTVEQDGETVAMAPLYVGTQVDATSAMPAPVRAADARLQALWGSALRPRVVIVGSLISDLGWIPLHPECDRPRAVAALLDGVEAVARAERADVLFVKDLHRDFPYLDRLAGRGFTRMYSLPTVRVGTDFPSFEAYQASRSKNARKKTRKLYRTAEGRLELRTLERFDELLPGLYPLFRATFRRALVPFAELPPAFFAECARVQPPGSELIVCEHAGRTVGAMLNFFRAGQQLNKRLGLDYGYEDPALVYNLLNYEGLRTAIGKGIREVYLGQSTYIPKLRMGGALEDQLIFAKAYRASLRAALPLQKLWMSRFRSDRVASRVRGGARQ